MNKFMISKLSGSQPLNATNDVTTTTPDGEVPPELCQCTEALQKFLNSNDFQQIFRSIVREETSKAIRDECNALKKTESFQHPSSTYHVAGSVDCGMEQQPTVKEATVDKLSSLRFGPQPSDAPNKTNPNPASRLRKEVHDSEGVRHETGSKPVMRLSRDDERECLSQALQANIVDLVDRLQFNTSTLPDQLITSGHMTEEECRMLRNDISSRKDKVRYLISRTKCRDLKDIHKFLNLINSEVPDVVSRIRQQFEENKKNNVKCKTCALCQCANNVDIKDFVDILWSIRAVSDGFYNEVIACNKPRGSQELLWKSLVDICNGKQYREKRKAFGILFEFMQKKGNFDFIVRPLQGMLERDGRLECHCYTSLKSSLSDQGSCSLQSSCSPRSSYSARESRESILSGDLSQDVDQFEERPETIDKRSDKKLERQNATDGVRSEMSIEELWLSQAARLGIIQGESSKPYTRTSRKGIDYVYQTVEFHGPICTDHTDFKWKCLSRSNKKLQELRGFEPNASSEA